MGKSVPMLSDPKQLKVWDQIGEVYGIKRRKSAESSFRRAADSVRSLQYPDGVLIQRLCELAAAEFPEMLKETVLALESMLGKDCPDAVLRISDLLMDAGEITYAESVMAKAGDGGDRELSCRVHGKLDIHQGRTEDAVDDLIEAWSLNPSDPDTYGLLQSLEPDYGWQYILCIERMWEGGDLLPPKDAVPCAYSDLWDCCSEWSSGRRSDAMSALQSSDRFGADSYFQVTYARMCIVTGLYSRAQESYRNALSMSPGMVFAMSEAASAMRLSGDYQDSINMCHSALNRYPGCRTAREEMIQASADSGRQHETDGYISKYLALPPEDATAYAFCASVLYRSGRRMEATNLVKRMEVRCTDRSYACLQMSVDEARNGEWKKAVGNASRAKKLDKDNVECMCQLSKCYLGVGNTKLAEKEAEAALKAVPGSISAMSAMKDVHIAKGENEKALALLDQIIASVPRDAAVRKDRADLLGVMGRHSESLDGYRDSLNIRDDLLLFVSVITKMLKERRIQDLCRFVDDYDDSYGNSAEVWMIRGNGEYLSGMYGEAASSYSRAAALSYNDPVIWHSKGMAEQMDGDLKSSQSSFDRAIILDLENPDYWMSKALVQEQIGDLSGAVQSVNKVINLIPDSVYPLAVKARFMVALRMYDEALFFLDLALRISPNDLRLHSMKKDIYMHIGSYEEAVKVCGIMLQIDKDDLKTEADRAIAVLGAGRPEEAQSMINELHNRHKNEYEVIRGEARFYTGMKEYRKAADCYEHLLTVRPDDTGSAEELLKLYGLMGMAAEAEALSRRLRPEEEESDPQDEGPDEEDTAVPEEPVTASDDGDGSVPEEPETSAEDGLKDLMDSDLSSSEPFLVYIDLMLDKGDTDAALDAAQRARSLFSSDTMVIMALGDVQMRRGDTLGALASYTEASDLGMSTPLLYLRKGDAEYELNLYQRALDSYGDAVRCDPVNRDALIGLSRVHMRLSQRDLAAPFLDSVIARDPSDSEALKMRTEIFVSHDDTEGVLSLYPMIERHVTDLSDLQYFADALRSVGEEEKAATLFAAASGEERPEDGGHVPGPEHRTEPIMEADRSMGHMERTEEEIETMAAEVLIRSADTGFDADDARLYSGMDSWDAEAVRRFFRTAQPYPFINPGDCFFSDLEAASYDIVIGEGISGIDSEPVVSLEMVYRHCRSRDMESVRRLQAYINFALTDDGDPIPFSKEVEDMAARIRGSAMSVYDIMKGYGVGVYTAVTARRLADQ